MINSSTRLRSNLIKSLLAVLIIFALSYYFRYQIFQYSAEKVVRKYLPDYIVIDRMVFDLASRKVVLKSVRIMNPPGFSAKYLLEIGTMECNYALTGNSVLRGVTLGRTIFNNATLYIERRSDGVTNLQAMSDYIAGNDQRPDSVKAPVPAGPDNNNKFNNVKINRSVTGKDHDKTGRVLSDYLKLPDEFLFKEGALIFNDKTIKPDGWRIVLNNINAGVSLKLDNNYTRAISLASAGSGSFGGGAGGRIKWDLKLDPTASALTMSNRFDVAGVDIMLFLPYYDRYSPLAIEGGLFSGVLVFDFDNGNIGSTNEIYLSKFKFRVKPGCENAEYLQSAVPDLVKYFSSTSGDIVFDFKIKGPMSGPQFYLGPISKQAIAAMAIDKIAQALSDSASRQPGSQGMASAATGGSDMEKASEYINMFKSLMKDSK